MKLVHESSAGVHDLSPVRHWVGIDVSGETLEVFVRPISKGLKLANSPAGLATLVSELLEILLASHANIWVSIIAFQGG